MKAKVREWLEKSGFTLEMRAAAAFQAAGFEVRQCDHYIDPESGKAREIDVIARDPDSYGIIDITFVVECKASEKPWALLCSPDTLVNYNRLRAFAVVSKSSLEVMVNRLGELLDCWPWLKKDRMAAYSVRQSLSESDVAFTAAVTAAKAAESWVRRPKSEYKPPYIFAFPVIVVNAPLLQCSLSSSGDIDVVDVTEGEWLFFARIPEFFGTCIRIVSIERLPAFAEEARAAARAIRDGLKLEEAKVIESWGAVPRETNGA
jgi:hypothetical protein